MSEEIWLEIPGYEGRYAVSNFGHVRSLPRTEIIRVEKRLRGRILRPAADTDGYLQVALGQGNTVKVHHLVLAAFSSVKPEGKQARHLNGKRSDNRSINLVWGTAAENNLDMDIHLTRPKGSNHANSKLCEEDIPVIRLLRSGGKTLEQIADMFKVSRGTIGDVIAGRTWGHIP